MYTPEWTRRVHAVHTWDMPNKEKTKTKSIRIEDTLWKTALTVAAGRDESVSDVVRRSLHRYVSRYGKRSQ